MWIVIVIAGMLSLFVANSAYNEYVGNAMSLTAVEAGKDVASYNAFSAAAQVYMSKSANWPVPVAPETWAVIQTNIGSGKGLPSALQNVYIPATWGIARTGVVMPDGSPGYVICALMPMTSAAAVTKNYSGMYQLSNMQFIKPDPVTGLPKTYDFAVLAYNPSMPGSVPPTDADVGFEGCKQFLP